MSHCAFVDRRPKAIPSSTCIMVSISKLIPGTKNKTISQYHGRSIIFKMAKAFNPGTYPCHTGATPDLLIKAGINIKCSRQIRPSKIQGIKLILVIEFQ